jgi:phosphotriesterase-related protein
MPMKSGNQEGTDMKRADASSLNRREALSLLGAGAGLGLIGGWNGAASLAAQAGAVSKMPPTPQGAIIRTILKDLPPSGLGNGSILFHEHMSFNSGFFEKMRPANAPRPTTPTPPSYLENVDLVTEEVKASGKEGVSCIVDGGHPDMGTNYTHLKQIAERSGVHIVGSGGYYLQTTYPPEVTSQSEDQLVDGLVKDAATYRWGAFGEIGSSEQMTADERKVFRVMAKTHLRTGIPVFTHTSHAGCKACALEQLDILEKAGMNLRYLAIGHLSDITDDPQAETHKAIAKRGAFLGFDTVGHRLGQGDSKKLALIMKVLDAGYEDHVLLSADFASEPEIKANGGAGYSSVPMVFVPKLRYAGVKEAVIHKIMVENPKRFLAFIPAKKSG